jgi:hypothetical protein
MENKENRNSTNKVDQGQEFVYWNLSYKRKLIRTLWLSPLVLIVLIIPEPYLLFNLPKNIFFSICLAAFLTQIIYNYYRWKKEETQ